MVAIVVGLLCVFGAVVGAPLKTFDQRQQGELNIHAQLDNIVIVFLPASNFNLLELASKTKYSSEKPGTFDKGTFLQFFQKPHKTDIDRYETVNDVPEATSSVDSQNDIKSEIIVPVITSQRVRLNNDEKKNSEKEEEVIATVEEMKPETTVTTADLPKQEATEDSPIKEHSTISESVQESDLKISIPEDLNDDAKTDKDDNKESLSKKKVEEDSVDSVNQHSKPTSISDTTKEHENTSADKTESSATTEPSNVKKGESSEKENLSVTSVKSSQAEERTIEDIIRPVAAKEEKLQEPDNSKKTTTSDETFHPVVKKIDEPMRLVEGGRKEKLIRYKPDTKWAPELVDLLGPPKPKEERQRFASLCSPGVWDTELKTCIMPGETRSRNELARFLEAMRFGIAIPAQ